LLGFGDSFTSGGGSQSYPYVAAGLLNWQKRNYAVGGAKTNNILPQLVNAGTILSSATDIVLTIGGNDIDGIQSLANIAQLNIALFEQKAAGLKSTLVSTYKLIKGAVRPETKIYAVPYVDFVSVGNKVPYEAESHRIMRAINNAVRDAAAEANISYIDTVISAFLGHEMYSTDPFIDDFSHPTNAVHPNLKGYAKIGEVVAAYIKANAGL
jgi:lysophospholipase L1-like esterase